jgi:hypothetical protein
MTLTSSPTELTTAVTDLLLACVLSGCLWGLRGGSPRARFRAILWRVVFGLTALSALLGAVAHGCVLAEGARWLLWQPLYLSLGTVVALFVVAAIHDGFGARAARWSVPPMLLTALGFWAWTALAGGDFLLFVLYEAVAMLFSLAVYVRGAAIGRPSGAATIALAIVLNLVAAAIQSSDLSLTVVWPFDHNGLFHLAQIVAIGALFVGVRRSLAAPAGA